MDFVFTFLRPGSPRPRYLYSFCLVLTSLFLLHSGTVPNQDLFTFQRSYLLTPCGGIESSLVSVGGQTEIFSQWIVSGSSFGHDSTLLYRAVYRQWNYKLTRKKMRAGGIVQFDRSIKQTNIMMTEQCVCVCVLYVVYTPHICAYLGDCGGWRLISGCLPLLLSTLFFQTGLSLNLEFTSAARLAAQWAPGIFLFLPPKCWVLGIWTQVLMLPANTLPTGQPLVPFLKSHPSLSLAAQAKEPRSTCLHLLGADFADSLPHSAFRQVLDVKLRSSYLCDKHFINWAFLISSSVFIDFFLMT